MVVDAASGWVDGVERLESPNCDPRPVGCVPELIIIHGISLPPGEFGGKWIDRLFLNDLPRDAHPYFAEIDHLRVSSHLLVRRNGSMTQFVSLLDRAWHAGESSHCGREACNDFSIGIELEGTDDLPYDQRQYESLAAVIAAMRSAYPSLERADIVGHSDVAPGRKTDPGEGFAWSRLRLMLEATR